ncbi:hypothetical protein [Streptomyces sp. NPDC010273]|uniref:hypothetical protein n=1 Tax=Streptomyces sp. NPDC010273 TaxID=3364829 RepID=UPI0036EFC5B7
MVRDEIQLAIPGRRPSGEDVPHARQHRDERIATMDRQASPTLGAVLKAARRRIGVTQSQLADLSTVSVRTIRDLELDLTHNPAIHLLCTRGLIRPAGCDAGGTPRFTVLNPARHLLAEPAAPEIPPLESRGPLRWQSPASVGSSSCAA